MLSAPPSIRLWIVASVLVGATVLLHTVSHGEAIVARQPLRQLPSTIEPVCMTVSRGAASLGTSVNHQLLLRGKRIGHQKNSALPKGNGANWLEIRLQLIKLRQTSQSQQPERLLERSSSSGFEIRATEDGRPGRQRIQ